MSRSHNRPRPERAEVPLPERGPVNRTPDFIPVVLKVAYPRHDDHYRTTFMDEGEDFTHKALHAYVEHKFHEHDECRFHIFSLKGGLARFGFSDCIECGATAWSPWWVAAGLYGLAHALADTCVEITHLDIEAVERGEHEAPEDGTGAYIVDLIESFEARVSGSAS